MDGVVKTASDAMACKQSFLAAGYTTNSTLPLPTNQPRRSPLTNRLYLARYKAVHRCVELLSMCDEYQLLVLGCGHDESFTSTHSSANIYYVDLPAIVPTSLSSGRVHKICCDLNHPLTLFSLLSERNFNFQHPTIVVLECVLGYLTTTASQTLITELQRRILNCSVVLYDPVMTPTAAYTTALVAHFTAHNATLHSIFSTPYHLYSSFRDAGWRHVLCMNMHQALELLLVPAERRVNASTEPFDEFAALATLNKIYHTSIITNNFNTFNALFHRIHSLDTNAARRNVRMQLLNQRVDYHERYDASQQKRAALQSVAIQPAQRSHLEGIIRLQKENYEELMKKYKAVSKYVSRSIKQLEHMLTMSECTILIALAQNDVIGSITLTASKSETSKIGVIGHLNITEQYKRRGIASMLYQKVLAKENSYQRLELTTLADLTPAICFYKSVGYQVVKTEDIGLGCELVHMSKPLLIGR